MLVAVTIIYILVCFLEYFLFSVKHLELFNRLVKTWKLLIEEKRAGILVKKRQKLKMRKRWKKFLPRGNLRLSLMI